MARACAKHLPFDSTLLSIAHIARRKRARTRTCLGRTCPDLFFDEDEFDFEVCLETLVFPVQSAVLVLEDPPAFVALDAP